MMHQWRSLIYGVMGINFSVDITASGGLTFTLPPHFHYREKKYVNYF
jgi:hypothetical protein